MFENIRNAFQLLSKSLMETSRININSAGIEREIQEFEKAITAMRVAGISTEEAINNINKVCQDLKRMHYDSDYKIVDLNERMSITSSQTDYLLDRVPDLDYVADKVKDNEIRISIIENQLIAPNVDESIVNPKSNNDLEILEQIEPNPFLTNISCPLFDDLDN